jgi:hypothetical protein
MRRTDSFTSLLLVFLTPGVLSAAPMTVRHREGTSHGFVLVRSTDGEVLGAGDAIQTISGDRISSSLELHFKDGSVHEEQTEFTQGHVFKLLSDHLRQQGPSFPNPVDTRIDAARGKVSVRDKDGKTNESPLKMPDDVANGLLTTMIKDMQPSDPAVKASYVITSPKPQVVSLQLRPSGEEPYSAGGASHQALHVVAHIHVGGAVGVLASVTGKQPADFHFWIATGKAPTFLRFLGPLYDGGPSWIIELAAPRLQQERSGQR